jgi:hypothetical protein
VQFNAAQRFFIGVTGFDDPWGIIFGYLGFCD